MDWSAVLPSSSASPSGRMGMASGLDADSGVWFVYGGWSGGGAAAVGGFLSDLWSFAFNDSSWRLVQQPADATEFPTPRQPDSSSSSSSSAAAAAGRSLTSRAAAPSAVINSAAAMSSYMLFVYESAALRAALLALPAASCRCRRLLTAAALLSAATTTTSISPTSGATTPVSGGQAAHCSRCIAACAAQPRCGRLLLCCCRTAGSGYWTQHHIAATILSVRLAGDCDGRLLPDAAAWRAATDAGVPRLAVCCSCPPRAPPTRWFTSRPTAALSCSGQRSAAWLLRSSSLPAVRPALTACGAALCAAAAGAARVRAERLCLRRT